MSWSSHSTWAQCYYGLSFVDEELGFVGMKRSSKSRSKVQNSKLTERVGPGAGWPDLSSGSNTSRHGVLGHVG